MAPRYASTQVAVSSAQSLFCGCAAGHRRVGDFRHRAYRGSISMVNDHQLAIWESALAVVGLIAGYYIEHFHLMLWFH